MASKTSPTLTHGSPTGQNRPAWTTPLFVVLGLLILAVVATQLLGRASDKDVASFRSANAMVGSALPVLVSAIVAWLIPQGQPARVRLPIALMAGLFVIFITSMWPSVAVDTGDGAAPPEEMTTLLSWLIGMRNSLIPAGETGATRASQAGAVAVRVTPKSTWSTVAERRASALMNTPVPRAIAKVEIRPSLDGAIVYVLIPPGRRIETVAAWGGSERRNEVTGGQSKGLVRGG